MASQAQRDWAAAGRAAAEADPEKYASIRIESSVDRSKTYVPPPSAGSSGMKSTASKIREKTEKAIKAAAAAGREYRGPTPEQVAAGTLEVGTPTTKHRKETRRVAIAKDLPTIHAKEPTDVLRTTDEYRGPTPAQIAAGTLEVEPPTTVHRVKARAAALLKPEIKTGEIPQELVALRTREKTLELMEEALTTDIHPIVRGEYRGTREEYQKYQRQFGEYETEYKDYSKEYERVKDIYEARQKIAEELKPKEIAEAPPVHEILPVREVEPPTLKPPLLEGLEKYAVAPPVEVRRLPPVTTGVIPLYEPVQEIKKRIIEGYGLGIGEPLDVKTKKISKDVLPFEKYTTAPIWKLSTEMASKYEEFREKAQKGIVEMPGGIVGQILTPARKIGVGITRTPTIVMETMGLLPIGAEFVIREPAVAAEMAPIGVGLMAGGIVTGIRERPFETTGELIGMMLGPKVITKIIKPPKIPEIPYAITRKTILPEGVLLKGKIGVTPEVVKPPTTTLVEYKPPKVETFIGKIKDDVAELYVKVPETELDILSRITSEKAPRTILTKEGKFMVIEEPRYIEAAPSLPKLLAGEPKVTLREKVVDVIPYEIIKKVDIKPIRLQTTVIPERMMLPEFTTTIDVTPTYKPVTWGKYLEGTKGWLEVGKTRAPRDITKPLIRKDIVEVPYTRDVSIGIGEESAILGRVLSKTERAMVRDVISKERIEFEPLKIVTPPKPTTVFDSVSSVSVGIGMQQIVKPKMAPVALKEKVEISTIDLSKDLLMPQSMAEIVVKPKMAPVALKEKAEIPTIDLEALFKRPTYEQVMAKRLVTTKEAVKPKFAPIAFGARVKPIHEIKVIDTVIHKAIPSEKEDMVKKIAIFGVSLPKTKVDMVTQFKIAPVDKTLVKPELYKPPPPPKVAVAKPPIKPILPIRLKKEDKKDKKKKARKVKEFEVLYTNPIASPFTVPSTGKIKKNK